MAEEELVASPVPSPTITDHHKRKLEDLEAPAPESTTQSPSKTVSDHDSSKNDAEEEENGGADELEPKRLRLEANVNEPDVIVSQNGHQEEEKGVELKDVEIEQSEAAIDNSELVLDAHEPVKESLEIVIEERVFNEDSEDENGEEPEQSKAEVEESSKELPEENNVPSDELQSVSGTQIISRQMEVPNDKVGVLIGKAGDTIRSLQDNSGAKIQIMKDAEADPQSTTRPLELIGTLENITKAEKLIKAVIAEADAGGSPSLVARGFNTVQTAGGGEQLEIQVPIEKVGIIIGKGGETIRNLQTRYGARIQLMQHNLSEANQPTERTVRVSGSKKQIETATDMIKDVMNQRSMEALRDESLTPLDDGTIPDPPSSEEVNSMFKTVVGGKKKGRMYGCGSMSSTIYPHEMAPRARGGRRSSSQESQSLREMVERQSQIMEFLRVDLQSLQKENQELRDRLSRLEDKVHVLVSVLPQVPPTQKATQTVERPPGGRATSSRGRSLSRSYRQDPHAGSSSRTYGCGKVLRAPSSYQLGYPPLHMFTQQWVDPSQDFEMDDDGDDYGAYDDDETHTP